MTTRFLLSTVLGLVFLGAGADAQEAQQKSKPTTQAVGKKAQVLAKGASVGVFSSESFFANLKCASEERFGGSVLGLGVEEQREVVEACGRVWVSGPEHLLASP